MVAVAICKIWAQAESSLGLSGGHVYPPALLWGSLWEPDEDRHPAADDYLGLEKGAWSIKQGIRPVEVPRSSGRVSLSWGGTPGWGGGSCASCWRYMPVSPGAADQLTP